MQRQRARRNAPRIILLLDAIAMKHMDGILPEVMTLEQAAAWLTDKTGVVGVTWDRGHLLSVISSTIGPLCDIHKVLPVYRLNENNVLVTVAHSVVQMLYVRPKIQTDNGEVFALDDLIVRGFDLMRFFMSYCHIQDEIQKKLLIDNQSNNNQEEKTKGVCVPPKWSRGLKSVAFECAKKILESSEKLTGPALWDAISIHPSVSVKSSVASFKLVDMTLKGGESSAQAKTIKGDWRKALAEIHSKP